MKTTSWKVNQNGKAEDYVPDEETPSPLTGGLGIGEAMPSPHHLDAPLVD